MLKSKRVLSMVLAVFMLVGMLTCIVLPASAIEEDAYAKINATLTDGTYVPADNVYFIDGTIDDQDEPAVGDAVTYTYGDGTAWGNGKSYALTYKVNLFPSWTDAKTLMIDLSKTWAADTENNKDEAVFVFAPGSYGESTGQATLGMAATDPTEDDLFSVVMLGPKAGKSPVNPDRSTKEKAAEVQNNRGIAANEFIFKNTFWVPDKCISYIDGIMFDEKGKLYGGGTYLKTTLKNIYYTSTSGISPSGNAVIAFGNDNNNTIVHMDNCYFDYGNPFAAEGAQSLRGNDILVENCVFANGVLATKYSWGQGCQLQLYPNKKDKASANFYGEKKENPTIIYRNNAIAGWEGTHCLRITPNSDSYKTYSGNAVDVQITGNNFFDCASMSKGSAHVITINKATEDIHAGAYKLTITGNLFSFSKDWTKSKNGQVGSAINGDGGEAQSGYNWNISDNTFIMDPNKNHCHFYSLAQSMDVSGNVFMDNDGNIIAGRASYISSYSGNFNIHSDAYASDEKKGGVRELMTVKEIENGTACYSYVQNMEVSGTASTNYLRGVITMLLKRNDDGTAIEYNANTLLKFDDPDVNFEGIFADEACTTKVEKVTQDNVDGKYAKATYEAGNTKLTVIFLLTVPEIYNIVDPEGDYLESGYKFNGVTYKAGETASDGVTVDSVEREDGKTGFYQFIDVSHKDADGNTYPCAYDATPNPNTGDNDDIRANAMKEIIVLTPGTYNFESQGMGKSVCYVGPQFAVSPYDRDLAKQGKLANGRSLDPTKEAVVKGTLSPADDSCLTYVFDGLAFQGADCAISNGDNGKLNGSMLQFITIKNCVVGNTAKQPFYLGSDMKKGIKQLFLTFADCAFDSTGVERATDSFIYTRSNTFTMKRIVVLNDSNGGMSGTANARLAYIAWIDGKLIKTKHKRDYADFEDVVLYNSNRNLALLSLRDNATQNASFDYYPQGAEFNIKNCSVIGGYGYFFGVQNGEQTGAPKFIKLNATGNYFYRPAYEGNVISNYQTSKYTSINAFSDDSKVEDNVLITAPENMTFYACKALLNIDENFIGTEKDGKIVASYVRDKAINSEFEEAAQGVVKDLYTYYIDQEMTAKNTDVQLQDNGYKSITHGYFLGYNQTDIEIETAGTTVENAFKVPSGATIKGVYSDAELTTAVTGIIGKNTTLYVDVEHDATGVSCVTKANITIPCSHLGTKTAGTRVEATCGTDGYQEYTCDDCSAKVDAWTETLPATLAHTWDNGVESIAPTCQVMGTTLYTCTNENCLSDGTKATKTEQDIPVVNCESDGTWHEKTAPVCEADGEEIQICKWCSAEIASKPIAKLGHDWDEGVEDPVHNCMKDGTLTYTCQNDHSHTYTEVVPSTGDHNFVGTVKVPATCTTAGIITYTCGGCTTTHDEVIPVTGHDYVAVTTKEPTCVEDGILTYTCQNENCGDTYTTPAPANGSHDYKAEVTKYPTCTEDGIMTYTCQREQCGYVTTEAIPNKGGHQYGDWILRKPSTCTVNGSEYRICIECEGEEERELPLIDHVYDEEFTIDIKPTGTVKGEKSRHCLICKDARTDITDMGYCLHENTTGEWIIDRETTCALAGEKHQICADCGDICNITEIPVLPHTYIETNINKEPTCTEAGERALTCKECNAPTTEVIAALGHNPGAWRTTTPATCTANGEATQYCTVCDAPQGTRVIAATGHGEFNWIVTVAAGCVEDGISSYTCADCGTVTDTKVIAAKGHRAIHLDTYEATCTEDGLRDYECAICGEPDIDVVIPATGHTAGEWEIVVPATNHSYGVKAKYCTVCGEEVESDIIEQIVPNCHPFTDVANKDWYHKAVDFVYNSGLMNGITDKTFAPKLSTTRGMFVTILGRLSGIDADEYTFAYFEDVKDGSYYFGYIEWARSNSIVEGTGNYVFEPDRAITRQEMCKMIYSYANYEEIELSYPNGKTTFKDDAKIAKWARTYVYNCQRAGIVNGDTSGNFRPTDTANRAEIATLIMNFYDNCMK